MFVNTLNMFNQIIYISTKWKLRVFQINACRLSINDAMHVEYPAFSVGENFSPDTAGHMALIPMWTAALPGGQDSISDPCRIPGVFCRRKLLSIYHRTHRSESRHGVVWTIINGMDLKSKAWGSHNKQNCLRHAP
jgi:hypothetical protein